MTTKHKVLTWLTFAAGVAALASAGCVQNRASRNGVFNENQYLRKDFLIRSGDGASADPGWFMKVTITSTSTPNVLAPVNGAGLFAGAQGNGPNFVRFATTQDKLQLIDRREISSDPVTDAQGLRTPNIINAWPVTNVDLKYRINLDGEVTNFYEENQENNWQDRQWVKLNFAKNDMSDLQAFYADLNPVVVKCTNTVEASASLIPGSFNVDQPNNYFEFGVSVTLPISYTDTDAPACLQAFGATARPFFQLGRSTVTLNLLYSFVRPGGLPNNLADGTYVPMPITEKDPIRHKYGAFEVVNPYRDQSTGLLGAQELVGRFDPNRDLVWYFAPGVPDDYKTFFGGTDGTGGLAKSTNDNILSKAGGKGRMKFMNYNDGDTYGDGKGPVRKVGDARYSFVVYHSDYDNGSQLLGIAQFFPDNRTGQTLSASINVFEGQFKDTVVQRLDAFLQTAGAEFLTPTGEFDDNKYPATCTPGQTVPLVDAAIVNVLNAQSTVYGKMQAYMQKPVSTYGNLSPANLLVTHDSDFYNAYFGVLPYQVYADPEANQFVSPEGSVFGTTAQQNWTGLQNLAAYDALASKIDHGEAPWDVNGQDGIQQALAFQHQFNQLSQSVADYEHIKARRPMSSHADDISLFSYFDLYQKNGRRCIGGKWESRASYTQNLLVSLNAAVALHEFGHTLGLRHNFMGSVDQRNYPLDANGKPILYASSIMDYNQGLSEGFYTSNGSNWPPYDAAALAWIYGNNLDAQHVGPVGAPQGSTASGISGQVSAKAPWNDPLGFQADGTTERPFLYCSDEHLAYTPLCRQYDMGATPSEIMANEIQQREWNYLWTNFRLYHKYADFSSYGQTVARQFAEYRRFLSLWTFDWSPGELTNTLRLIGIKAPTGTTAADYYTQLTNKFNQDISVANQLGASYHRAIIDQSSGERPYITVFDPFYGDTTQQGIQIDKQTAVSSFASLWPAISNFDPSQAGSFQLSSAFGEDGSYNQLASGVMLDFLGAAFATYTYAQIGPLAAFAEETHSSFWPGISPMQAWIGGIPFNRERDFLDYLHAIAVKFQFQNTDENGLHPSPCTSLDNCTWDPRTLQVKPSQITQSDRYNTFQGPDGRTYIWMYLSSRNQWILADKDRNVALYTLMFNWAADVVNAEDDGYAGAQAYELKVKYALDSYLYFNNFQPNTP